MLNFLGKGKAVTNCDYLGPDGADAILKSQIAISRSGG